MFSYITSESTGLDQYEPSTNGTAILHAKQTDLATMGIQQVPNPDPLVAYTPISTATQVYYIQANNLTYVSSSQGELQRSIGAALDPCRLALALCSNLPSILRSTPFWKGVSAVAPGHALSWETGAVTTVRAWDVAAVSKCDAAEAETLLRQALTAAVTRRVDQYSTVSADLSGGIDSTSLSYLLNSISDSPHFYHSRTTDARNRDTHFARRAASDLRGTYVELEPFSSTMSAFSTTDDASIPDSHDGPWSWGSNALHLRNLLTDAASRNIQAHITGLGGDELFSVLPSLALALYRRGQKLRAIRSLINMAKKQRWDIAATLGAAASRRSFGAELLQRVREPTLPADGPHDSFAWAPGFALSPLASTQARKLVEERVTQVVDSGASPWFEDKYRHQVIESVVFQGEVIRQMNQAFADVGVTVEAPFVDDDIVALVLGLPPELTVGHQLSKPLLMEAVDHLVPTWVLERSDKGEYSADLFGELKRRRGALAETFAESYLIDNGYIDPHKVRAAIEQPLVGTSELFELEKLAAIEGWARRNA